ncbi:MAG: nucleotidyltransferase domain-containing protein [Chloroflexota bacterium]
MSKTDLEAAKEYYHARRTKEQARREAERQHWRQQVREAVARLGPHYPGIRRVFLFGSIVQAGRFRADSDIDLAVECDSADTESRFWRALERELKRDVDVRPLTGAVASVALSQGEQIYG